MKITQHVDNVKNRITLVVEVDGDDMLKLPENATPLELFTLEKHSEDIKKGDLGAALWQAAILWGIERRVAAGRGKENLA